MGELSGLANEDWKCIFIRSIFLFFSGVVLAFSIQHNKQMV